MPVLALTFPGFDPVLIQIGPFAIRWYALAYICGILLGWWYARFIIRTGRFWPYHRAPLKTDDYDDFIVWITIGIIVGGRAGYVLFYNLPHFIAHPLEIFELWKGGMAFHGGFAGCVLAVILFAKRRGISILSLADITAAAGPIGLFLGRIANFINGELWGRATDMPWAVIFPAAGNVPRHPSQLYEAVLEGIVLFVLLAALVNRGALRSPGFLTGTFAVGYAVARIVVENFREPDAQLGFLWGSTTMGMLLSFPLLLAGFGFIGYALWHSPPRLRR